MGKIYESEEDYQRAFEEDFKAKCEMISMYQGNQERTTIDGEWTESELKEDLWTEARKVLKDEGWLDKCKGRALRDPDLLHEEFLVENICGRYDLIEIYNKAYDYHRNDKPRMFGIHYFDELARAEVIKTLKGNMLTG